MEVILKQVWRKLGRWRYLSIGVSLIFPGIFVLSFLLKDSIDFNRLVATSFAFMTIGIWWDMWATKSTNDDAAWLWQFNPKTLSGYKFLGHPIEEFVFVLSVPLTILWWEFLSNIYRSEILELVTFSILVLWEVLILVLLWKVQRE